MKIARQLALLLIGLWLVMPARLEASSDEAWAKLRADVATACLAAVDGLLEDATANVDPFGSPSFGLAIMHGREQGGDGQANVVCVYDKRSGKVEVGSAIGDAGN